MPDCSDSPWAISTMAMAGGFAFIPRDARLADIGAQTALAKESLAMLDDPPFPFTEGTDAAFATQLWKSNVVGIVEANPYKALKRAESLYNAGVRTVRVYSPEGGIEGVYTVRALRSEFGDDIEILAGMTTSGANSRQYEEAGADATVLGIGGGGICLTPTEAALGFASVKILHENKKASLQIPTIVEGGVGRMTPVVLSLGASAVTKSHALFGGTIEQPGGAHYYIVDGQRVKPYGGEASDRTRELAHRPVDICGNRLFREGDEAITELDERTASAVDNLWLLQQSLCTALTFARARTVAELHQNPPVIFSLTPNNQEVASIHHKRNSH